MTDPAPSRPQKFEGPRRIPFAIDVLGLAMRGLLMVVDVEGISMQPTLRPGDRLLCSRAAHRERGAIVVRDTGRIGARRRYQIKRLSGLAGDDRDGEILPPRTCWVESDNKAAGGDWRAFGPVDERELIAVAVAVLREGRIIRLA
jgi:hypothetical protein